METIGDRIRLVREEAGISRRELAKRIGARGESYIAGLELGQIKRGSRLHQIADELNVRLAWLETGKGPRTPPYPTNQPTPLYVRDDPSDTMRRAYLKARPATQAAVDLLLLSVPDRLSLRATHELVSHCMDQLELHAPEVLRRMKSA